MILRMISGEMIPNTRRDDGRESNQIYSRNLTMLKIAKFGVQLICVRFLILFFSFSPSVDVLRNECVTSAKTAIRKPTDFSFIMIIHRNGEFFFVFFLLFLQRKYDLCEHRCCGALHNRTKFNENTLRRTSRCHSGIHVCVCALCQRTKKIFNQILIAIYRF